MANKAESIPLTPEQEKINKTRAELDKLNPEVYMSLADDENNFRGQIKEKDRQIKKIETESKLDKLTGLFNRGTLFDEGRKLVAEAIEKGEDCSVIMIDYDNFKHVNDTYGHPVGDKALKELARVINERISLLGFGARYGGDEFSIFLPNTDKDDAGKMAEEIRAAVEKVVIKDAGREFANTISAGCASLKQVDMSTNEDVLESMIALADKALYSTKSGGRNRVTIYGDDLKK
jgi:diguanylate cyclase (GGDEF)-like protein